MNHLARTLALLGLLSSFAVFAQQEDRYDYFQANRQMIRNGMQALLMCNGLFTGGRSLENVIEQELAYMQDPRMIAAGGMVGADEYLIDADKQAVAVGGPESGTVVRTAFREGIGCVVMAPDQDFDDIDSLPKLELPYPDFDPATTPWPNGDLVAGKPLPPNVDARALQAASDFAFKKHAEGHVTLSLLVVYKGDIIHERYADGMNMTTRTRTWSTAKSIAATLIGMLVDRGKLSLDEPLGFEWEPRVENPQNDPRNKITLRHVLNMSSGLYPVDSSGREYAIGSGLSYWAGASSIHGMRDRGLIREPGTFWDYENYDTLLAVYAMKQALGSDKAYQEFPRRALLDKIGMRNTLISADRFHDFILSSQVYTNARDLARFGLLYLHNGIWDGEPLLSEDWIDFSRTPAPATRHRGSMYGGQWWLVPDDRNDVPKSAYSSAGNRGQFTIVVPTHDTVIVRRGLDYGRRAVTNWDYAREVLKAIGPDAEISR